MLKHQAISIHSADKISIVLDQFHAEILVIGIYKKIQIIFKTKNT